MPSNLKHGDVGRNRLWIVRLAGQLLRRVVAVKMGDEESRLRSFYIS